MRPFIGWPRWALVVLVAVLVRTGLLPRMLNDAQRELWRREMGLDVEGVRGWWCVAPGGIQ